jgi:phosphoglycerol transferase
MRWLWLFIISAFVGYLLRGYYNISNWGGVSFLIFAVAAAKYFELGHLQYKPDNKRLWSISSIAALSWGVYVYFIHTFGVLDIPSLIFHLEYGIEGNGAVKAVTRGVTYLSAIILFTIAISFLTNMDIRFRKLEWKIGLFFILINPVWGGVYDFAYGYSNSDGHQLIEYYVEPTISHLPEGKKKNLIVIYLESLEKTFSRPEFGDVYSSFNDLETKSTDFSGVFQAEYTGWTIAGMAASQCGIPLLPLGLIQHNQFNVVDKFLPGTTCLGDILHANGYQLSYIGGASTKFAGKGTFYTTHGFDKVAGFDELSQYTEPNYVNEWGLYDDTLFEIALKEIEQLDKAPQPYGLFMLTIAGHMPNGFVADKCRHKMESDDNYLLAVKCTGYLVEKFVESLDDAGYLENTQIIILSDHLAMKNPQWEKLQRMERTNTLFFYPKIQGMELVHRNATTMDTFPTILDALGFELNTAGEAGLGRSLLRQNNQTLVERFSLADLNRYIFADTELRRRVWGIADN